MMTQPTAFNLYDYFFSEERLEAIASHPAIAFGGQSLTYRSLKEEVNNWIAKLSAAINSGERVALLLYDSPEFVAAFFATLALGAIVVPINTFSSNDDIDFILADSQAKVLVGEASLLEERQVHQRHQVCTIVEIDRKATSAVYGAKSGKTFASNPTTTAASPAFILYTSGSTGTPKGVLHLHGNVVATIAGFGKQVLKLAAKDKVFSSSRLFFAYGLGNSLSFPLAAAASVILEADRPTPPRLAAIFREQQPTVFYGVPAIYRALLDFHQSGGHLNTASLRLCISAGEALPATIFEEWQQVFGMEILDGIGSTEMLHMFMSNREGEARAGSSGKVVDGYEARILNDDGTPTDAGEQGNLWVKGASAMRGYWGRDDLTAKVLQDGWMRTGDVYRQGEDGYFYHIGRSDDCFKVKGLWVSPIEVESALLAHPQVAEAAVVVSTDAHGLATAKAFLVIRTERVSDSFTEELLEFVRQRIAPYKAPTQFEVIAEMPRTSTGKIQRYKLRQGNDK